MADVHAPILPSGRALPAPAIGGQARSHARNASRTQQARRFVIAVAATYVLGVASIVAFSAYVNPWGNFGPTGYHNMYNARLAKTDYFDRIPPDQRPQVIVLGASSVMGWSPATIDRLLGKTAFNYGVFVARMHDMLCIARHIVLDLDHRPELFIVGIETWTFKPPGDEHPIFPGVRRRLLNTPQLVRHHPDVSSVKLAWSKFIDCFSSQQLELSWKLLRDPRATRQRYVSLGENDLFASDGTRTFYRDYLRNSDLNTFVDANEGTYPVTQLLEERRKDQNYLTFDQYDFSGLWDSAVRYLEEFVNLCDEHNIRIVFVMNPVHPVFASVICQHTPHLRNLQELHDLCARIERDSSAVIGTLDATRIEYFGGKAQWFYDESHPAAPNADLILKKVADMVGRR